MRVTARSTAACPNCASPAAHEHRAGCGRAAGGSAVPPGGGSAAPRVRCSAVRCGAAGRVRCCSGRARRGTAAGRGVGEPPLKWQNWLLAFPQRFRVLLCGHLTPAQLIAPCDAGAVAAVTQCLVSAPSADCPRGNHPHPKSGLSPAVLRPRLQQRGACSPHSQHAALRGFNSPPAQHPIPSRIRDSSRALPQRHPCPRCKAARWHAARHQARRRSLRCGAHCSTFA